MMLTIFEQLGLAVLLGLLVGLQRERTESSVAGIRTFPFITVLGTVCASLGQSFGGWVVAAGLLAMAALFVFANLARLKAGDIDPGLTTEMAALLMFGVGALLVVGPPAAAVAIGGGVAMLLQWKKPLHQFVRHLGEVDIRAIMQFVLITLVILPVLPNRAFGPYAVLNPFKIWLLVVLIVGLSLGGYIAYKLLGPRAGMLLGGALGGLVSSTATTVSFARLSRGAGVSAGLGAAVIMIASTIVYARVLVLVGVAAAGSFVALAGPLAVMLVFCAVVALAGYLVSRREQAAMPPQENPAQLKSALSFGVLYAVVLVAVAAAKDLFGDRGLYVVAVLSGLTDMDAITLSTAGMVERQGLDSGTGWRVILLASLANFVFKAGVVAVLGGAGLRRRIGVMFGLALAGGAAILWLWPK
jgi:uncharacterized membrane protein (DUF4010 family)